jgi:hypothetical protein
VLPWPMLVRADCALALGDRATAAARFSEALTFAAEIEDPCYQALALRGLGLLELPTRTDEAMRLLTDAVSCTRTYRDVYPWARAVILTDLVEVQNGTDPRVLREARDLAALGPLPDLAERLEPYRRRESGGVAADAVRQTPVQTAPA